MKLHSHLTSLVVIRCSVPPAPLPIGRTNCGAAFDITGVDFAGPLYLRDNEKHWIAVFTCASYRPIHLELCKSLSTEDFMLAFRRFIARRGKPKTVYSDNGTNFRGTSNLLNSTDWERVSLRTTSHKIEWRFNPPQAPWWGGFWERKIKIIKEMLRKILGKACLDFTSLLTILCEIECIMNNRPLTYIADDTENLKPLTQAMFLQDLKPEYLSLLKQLAFNKSRIIKVGDIVLVELESKRVDWPLAVVTAVFPGSDGVVRVARVKTAMGEKIRPLQRLFPLKVPLISPMPNPIQTDPVSPQLETQQTRCDRSIKIPQKLDL
ncbi:uncharacterized protein LOC131841263 [Achroia grisella]|uniref:uncharacterized protein LOC131841263 n=1 Tax=Achroia grisella TaxID=688607 RepID=UPI0027D307FB|nr:uncharacterized protein LOC131841263 [Achroia grisella]